MSTSEKIKVNGNTVTLIQSDSGRWSTNYGTSDTRAGAIRMAAAGIKESNAQMDAQYAAQRRAIEAHDAKTTECSVCRVRVSNMAAHVKSARHKNALAWSNYQRNQSYRV